MSIFDDTFTEQNWKCVMAVKNITDTGEYKHMIINLIYELNNEQAEVQASYAVNVGGKVSKEMPVKMVIKKYDLSGPRDEDAKVIFKRALKAFRPEEMTEEMVKDINTINQMFDLADKEVRRVYL